MMDHHSNIYSIAEPMLDHTTSTEALTSSREKESFCLKILVGKLFLCATLRKNYLRRYVFHPFDNEVLRDK